MQQFIYSKSYPHLEYDILSEYLWPVTLKNIDSRTNSFQAIGGNIMTASPISDLNPVFMAARCTLTLAAAGGNVHLQMLGFKMWSLSSKHSNMKNFFQILAAWKLHRNEIIGKGGE